MLTLSRALRIQAPQTIAFVGAGGKTTAMFQLARELAPALVSTTTHLGNWQVSVSDLHLIWPENEPMPDVEDFPDGGILLLTGPLDPRTDRYTGLAFPQLAELREVAASHSLSLLIEADGARRRPLKAPAPHEPVIPDFVDLVVVTAGLSALGKHIDGANVHRPQLFSKLADTRIGEIITPDALARVLTDPAGGLKGIPLGSRRVTLLNQAVVTEVQAQAAGMVPTLLSSFHAVVISNLERREIHAVHEVIAGIILAAGQGSRFGKVKQLLDYRGRPFVRAVAEQALAAGLAPIVVVTGAHAQKVEAVLEGLPIQIVRNNEWESGQASSVRQGVEALLLERPAPSTFSSVFHRPGGRAEGGGGAMFLLADQPQVTVEVLRALVEFHARELPPVVAPLVEDRRANPVLFDRLTFPDLLGLRGDQGGRALFSKYAPSYLPWMDAALLQDVDTPEDYDRLREYE